VLERRALRPGARASPPLKLEPASATPEQLTLPLKPDHWYYRDGCLRTGALRGVACSPSLEGAPPVELQLALQQAADARPQAIEVEGDPPWSSALGVRS